MHTETSGNRHASKGIATLAVNVLALSLAAVLAGCFGGTDSGSARTGVRVKPEFVRAESGAPSAKRAAEALKAAAGGPAWTSAVHITSLKVPIKQISLHNSSFDHEADIYKCAGSNDECQVEAAGTAFQDELDAVPVTVEMGEYDHLFVKTCEDSEGAYNASVTATLTLDGRTWYTNPASVIDTVGPARATYIHLTGCGRTYALPRPVRIADSLGEQVSFKLYFDIEGIAYAALGSRATANAWNPGGCTGDRPAETDAPSNPFLCIGYPDVSGLIDPRPVTLERYRINGGATVGLFFTADDLPLGGYTRLFFSEGVTADPGFQAVMPIRDLRKNADGTLFLAEFSNGINPETSSEFRVESFPRSSHSGTFASQDHDGATTSGTYSAVKLTP